MVCWGMSDSPDFVTLNLLSHPDQVHRVSLRTLSAVSNRSMCVTQFPGSPNKQYVVSHRGLLSVVYTQDLNK